MNSKKRKRPHHYQQALSTDTCFPGMFIPGNQPDFAQLVEQAIQHYQLKDVLSFGQFCDIARKKWTDFYEGEKPMSQSQFVIAKLGQRPATPATESPPLQYNFNEVEEHTRLTKNLELYDADMEIYKRDLDTYYNQLQARGVDHANQLSQHKVDRKREESEHETLCREVENHNRDMRNRAAGPDQWPHCNYKTSISFGPIDASDNGYDRDGSGMFPYQHPQWGARLVRKPKRPSFSKPTRSAVPLKPIKPVLNDPKYRLEESYQKEVINKEAFREAQDRHKTQVASAKNAHQNEVEEYDRSAHQLIVGGAYKQYVNGLRWELKPSAKSDPLFRAIKKYFKVRGFFLNFEPTLDSYRKYIHTVADRGVSQLIILFEPHCLVFPHKLHLMSHTYVTGMTRSGKSTLLQAIAFQLIKKHREQVGLCVLDPHASFGLEIAKYNQVALHSDQVFFFDPILGNISLNPFDIRTKDPNAITFYAESIAKTIEQLCRTDSTMGMETILVASIKLLLHQPSEQPATLIDLIRLMASEGKIERKYGQCLEKLTPAQQELFSYPNGYFYTSNAGPSRTAIQSRLQNFLGNDRFYEITCRTPVSSVFLKDIVDRHMIQIWCLRASHLGARGASALGRLILSSLVAIGQIHNQIGDQKDRPTLHIIADEAQNFVSDSSEHILTELTKSNKLLTLATQMVGQDMPSDFKKAVMANTNLKFVGTNDATQLKAFTETTGVPLDELLKLNQRDFCLHIKQSSFGSKPRPARFFRVSDVFHTQKDKFHVGDDQWQAFCEDQVVRYYIKPPSLDASPKSPKRRF